ncbi:terminase small subunit-like protein [Spiribacter onubensis]|uniref:Terminase small subunit n=1 Tax=Spiribacter onubensis TaxID=3122420 RepID=A0ABV3S947_9GAMM
MPAGRPSKAKPAITDEICRRVSEGEPIRSICADKHMPAMSTVMLWAVDGSQPEFAERYREARVAAGHAHAEKINEITRKVEAGLLKPDQARVMMDGLKWAAERMAANAYSPRHIHDHQSSDGSMSPQSKLSDEELDERIKRLAGK